MIPEVPNVDAPPPNEALPAQIQRKHKYKTYELLLASLCIMVVVVLIVLLPTTFTVGGNVQMQDTQVRKDGSERLPSATDLAAIQSPPPTSRAIRSQKSAGTALRRAQRISSLLFRGKRRQYSSHYDTMATAPLVPLWSDPDTKGWMEETRRNPTGTIQPRAGRKAANAMLPYLSLNLPMACLSFGGGVVEIICETNETCEVVNKFRELLPYPLHDTRIRVKNREEGNADDIDEDIVREDIGVAVGIVDVPPVVRYHWPTSDFRQFVDPDFSQQNYRQAFSFSTLLSVHQLLVLFANEESVADSEAADHLASDVDKGDAMHCRTNGSSCSARSISHHSQWVLVADRLERASRQPLLALAEFLLNGSDWSIREVPSASPETVCYRRLFIPLIPVGFQHFAATPLSFGHLLSFVALSLRRTLRNHFANLAEVSESGNATTSSAVCTRRITFVPHSDDLLTQISNVELAAFIPRVSRVLEVASDCVSVVNVDIWHSWSENPAFISVFCSLLSDTSILFVVGETSWTEVAFRIVAGSLSTMARISSIERSSPTVDDIAVHSVLHFAADFIRVGNHMEVKFPPSYDEQVLAPAFTRDGWSTSPFCSSLRWLLINAMSNPNARIEEQTIDFLTAWDLRSQCDIGDLSDQFVDIFSIRGCAVRIQVQGARLADCLAQRHTSV